jgi:hypothetical protein
MHAKILARLTDNCARYYGGPEHKFLTERVTALFGRNRKERNVFVREHLNPELTKRYGNQSARSR